MRWIATRKLLSSKAVTKINSEFTWRNTFFSLLNILNRVRTKEARRSAKTAPTLNGHLAPTEALN